MTEGLPPGWVRARLGELAEYLNGAAFKPTDWGDAGMPIIRIQNLTDQTKPFNRTSRVIDQQLLVHDGDILVSWSASLDAFIWRRRDAWLNQHIFRGLPRERLVHKPFLYFLLKTEIAALVAGEHLHESTMRHINRGPFLSHRVGVPSLGEQERTVAEIEKQFTRLDAAETALKRVRVGLARYRRALLQAACEGRLTGDAQNRSAVTDAQSGWKMLAVGDLLVRSEYGTSTRCDYGASGPPILRIPNIVRGEIDLSDIKRACNAIELTEESRLLLGDVLMCRTNGSRSLIGKVAVVRRELTPAHGFASYLLRFASIRQ